MTQYYALCVKSAGASEIALLDLGREAGLGQLIGIAVYTSEDGEVQREHRQAYGPDRVFVAPVSHEVLLDAARRAVPTSVFYDGHKVRGSVFRGMLKDALGLPLKHPRIVPH